MRGSSADLAISVHFKHLTHIFSENNIVVHCVQNENRANQQRIMSLEHHYKPQENKHIFNNKTNFQNIFFFSVLFFSFSLVTRIKFYKDSPVSEKKNTALKDSSLIFSLTSPDAANENISSYKILLTTIN